MPQISLRLHQETLVYGKRVAVDGKLGGMSRREFGRLLESKGGVLVDLSDARLAMVIVGAETQSRFLSTHAVETVTETGLWESLGFVEPESVTGRLYTPAMLAELLSVPVATVRRWHRRGLIQPAHQFKKLPYFDFQEVASARRIARLIDSGQSPAAIESRLSKLASDGHGHRPLSQLSIIVSGKDVLLRQGDGLIEPGGQQLLAFESAVLPGDDGLDQDDSEDQPPATVGFPLLQAGSDDAEVSPEDLLELAIDFEDDGDSAAAIGCYRTILLADGPKADIVFRVAELLYQTGDLNAARERYYQAIELEPSYVEARASLGCVLMELGESELAISSFKGALDQHRNYPDVHFHLAKIFTEAGRTYETIGYWESLLQLAPRSPWAEEAGAELERLQQ